MLGTSSRTSTGRLRLHAPWRPPRPSGVAPIDAGFGRLVERTGVVPGERAPGVPTRIFLLGLGTVGRAFLRLIAADPSLGRALQIVAAADRRGLTSREEGLAPEALVEAKRANAPAQRRLAPGDLAKLAEE